MLCWKSAQDRVGTLGAGILAVRSADLGDAGLQAVPTSPACSPELTMSLLISGRCCTPDSRAFATVLPGLDLCFVGWCLDGDPAVGGGPPCPHIHQKNCRAVLVFSELGVVLEAELHAIGGVLPVPGLG